MFISLQTFRNSRNRFTSIKFAYNNSDLWWNVRNYYSSTFNNLKLAKLIELNQNTNAFHSFHRLVVAFGHNLYATHWINLHFVYRSISMYHPLHIHTSILLPPDCVFILQHPVFIVWHLHEQQCCTRNARNVEMHFGFICKTIKLESQNSVFGLVACECVCVCCLFA